MKKPSKDIIQFYEQAEKNKRIEYVIRLPRGAHWIIILSDSELQDLKKGKVPEMEAWELPKWWNNND